MKDFNISDEVIVSSEKGFPQIRILSDISTKIVYELDFYEDIIEGTVEISKVEYVRCDICGSDKGLCIKNPIESEMNGKSEYINICSNCYNGMCGEM